MTEQALVKILLVDDQPNNLMALQDILEGMHVDLLTAGSGNEALSLIMQHDVALVLLDVQMPGMDGFEVASLMRQVSQSKHIPIIFITAHDSDIEATFKGYDTGAVDFIQKPIAAKVLRSKVHVFLEIVRQRRQIEQQNEELEERVAQRTAELQIALVASEAVCQAKSEFLSNTSHELRTPLNSLLILAQSLTANDNENLTPDQIEAVEVIFHDGKILLTLINDILDLTKVEAGQMKVHVNPVALDEMANFLHRQCAPLSKQKGLIFRCDVAGDLPATLITDEKRVAQILRNLLSNAIKFTEIGSVTLRISRAEEGTQFSRSGLVPDGTLAFSVTDTGIGIPQDKQKVIFESFQQVDGSTTRQHSGTGLGLAISRQFATLLGGELQVKSREGEGSTFTLFLPQKAASVTASEGETASEREAISRSGHRTQDAEQQDIPFNLDSYRYLQGQKILMVDDDMRNTFAQCRILEMAGMDVALAENGQVALEAIQREDNFCLVLMDVMMPVMDGFEAMRRIRQDKRNAHLPIIALTAFARNEDRDKCLEAGANDYLAKPIDHELLLSKISQYVRKNCETST